MESVACYPHKGYILVEIPSNLVLKKVGGNIWLPAITLLWGMLTCCMAAVHTFSGFLAVRFFLGAAEGGLLGGISLYLSGIYPRFSIQQRIARFYSAAAVAGRCVFRLLIQSKVIRL